MRYNEFIEKVKEILITMSEEDKTQWIQSVARTSKKHQRIDILDSLVGKQTVKTVIYEEKKLEAWFKKIEQGEIYFECSSYEEYGNGYWDSEYVYDYYDNYEIESKLTNVFQLAKDLLSIKKYSEACTLYNRLFRLEFTVLDVDTEEVYAFNLREIFDEKIIALELRSVVIHAMYAVFQSEKGFSRASKLYRYLMWDLGAPIKLEDIFVVGPEEIKEIDSFMVEWIAFLKEVDMDYATELLVEACLYQGEMELLHETAKSVYSRHPALYKYICINLLKGNKLAECERVGLEAMKKLPQNLIVRGEIADLIAKVSTELGHLDMVNKCYEVAFYSHSTLNNYLRLFTIPNCNRIINQAAKSVETLATGQLSEFNHKNKQLMINCVTQTNKDVIKFFHGEFDYVYQKFRKDKRALGWSNEVKGVFIPLFILLLKSDSEISFANEKLIDGIIHKLDYGKSDTKEFLDMFYYWRRSVVLTKNQCEVYKAWIIDEVDRRTDAIVGGGHRNSYYKAAILVVTLGEVLESDGMINGKAIWIERYKKRHSRKRAFKSEFDLLLK